MSTPFPLSVPLCLGAGTWMEMVIQVDIMPLACNIDFVQGTLLMILPIPWFSVLLHSVRRMLYGRFHVRLHGRFHGGFHGRFHGNFHVSMGSSIGGF